MRPPPPARPRGPAGSPIAPGAEATWTRADPADRRPTLEQPRHAPPRLSFGMTMKRFMRQPGPAARAPPGRPKALIPQPEAKAPQCTPPGRPKALIPQPEAKVLQCAPPGRPKALIPQPKAKGFQCAPPGRPKELIPQPKAKVFQCAPPGRPKALIPQPEAKAPRCARPRWRRCAPRSGACSAAQAMC